jgi:hypothetical protein
MKIVFSKEIPILIKKNGKGGTDPVLFEKVWDWDGTGNTIQKISQDGTGAASKSWDWAVSGPNFGTVERSIPNIVSFNCEKYFVSFSQCA